MNGNDKQPRYDLLHFPNKHSVSFTQTSETLFNDKLNFLLRALFYLAGVFNIDDLFKNTCFIQI